MNVPKLPLRKFLKFTDKNEHINQVWLNQMRESLLKGKGFLMISTPKFFVGQQAFSIVDGYGTVIESNPEREHDSHPVQVKFGQGENEVIDFFNQNGEDLNDARILFASKDEALAWIGSMKKSAKHVRIFNLYDDGNFTAHIDEKSSIAGQVFEETNTHGVRQLVKRHRVEWGS